MLRINKTTIPILKKSLNAYTLRHQAISQNIANIDTPNYKPFKVHFEEKLQDILQNKKLIGRKEHPRHMDIGKNILEVRESLTDLAEQNISTNLEEEMAELAKNQIRFEFAAKMLAGAYELIRSSIRGHVR